MKGYQRIMLVLGGSLLLCGCSSDKEEIITETQIERPTVQQVLYDSPEGKKELEENLTDRLEDLWLNEKISINADITPKRLYNQSFPVYAAPPGTDDTAQKQTAEKLRKSNPALTAADYQEDCMSVGISPSVARFMHEYDMGNPDQAAGADAIKKLGTLQDVVKQFHQTYGAALGLELGDTYSYYTNQNKWSYAWESFVETQKMLGEAVDEKEAEKLSKQAYYLIEIPCKLNGLELAQIGPQLPVSEQDTFEDENSASYGTVSCNHFFPLYVSFLCTEDGVVGICISNGCNRQEELRQITPVGIETVLDQFKAWTETNMKHKAQITGIQLQYIEFYMDPDPTQNNLRRRICWPAWVVQFNYGSVDDANGSGYTEYFYAATGERISNEASQFE